eukprot:1657969-Pleurochrysis_carterae.AAC.1
MPIVRMHRRAAVRPKTMRGRGCEGEGAAQALEAKSAQARAMEKARDDSDAHVQTASREV